VTALAIDFGSTACKASVIDDDGAVLGSGLRRLVTVFGPDGAAEQDAEQMWTATLDSSRQALAEAGAEAGRAVTSICVTSQWMSVVAVDSSGHPVAPLHMWFDRRGEQYIEPLTAGDDGRARRARWEEIHGFTPTASLGHILWFHRHPDIHRRAAAYLEPMDYLNARFTGRIAATANSAMPFTLTDTRHLGTATWSDELIDAAGVDRSRLPELIGSLQVLETIRADVADQLGLRHDVAVVTGANDSIAAAFGSGSFDDGQGTVMMGTTQVLVAHHRARHVDGRKFIITMPSALEDRYYVVAEGGIGGRILEAALSLSGGGGILDRAMQPAKEGGDADGPSPETFAAALGLAASSTAGSRGVMFLPWLWGALSPAPDPRLRGGFLGISLDTTTADLARAMLEGTSMQVRWLTDEVQSGLGVPFDAIRFVGGGAQSELWSAIMADVLGRPVEQLEHPRHANARGAGLMAFVSTGQLSLDDVPGFVRVRRCYEPDPANRQMWDERLDIYRQLHAVLADPISRLRP
jgi:xylulokinase